MWTTTVSALATCHYRRLTSSIFVMYYNYLVEKFWPVPRECTSLVLNWTDYQGGNLLTSLTWKIGIKLYVCMTILLTFLLSCFSSILQSSSSRMRVIYHNWSATKQHPHPQSVAEISRHSVLSGDRIRQCETSSGSRHKDTDQCLIVDILQWTPLTLAHLKSGMLCHIWLITHISI